ncbi:MAG TPA: cupin domain-containing protein [Bryobacteraceae bacterium]|nr:cupin domain-containing protein [Bryobacteraceae bacterium]
MPPAGPHDLAGILAPEDVSQFLVQVYGKGFLHIPGDPGKFAGLLPWERLNAILEEHRLQPPRLRLTREGKPVAPDTWLSFVQDARRSAPAIPRLDASALTRELRSGATLVLDAVDELQRPVRTLSENLERLFRVRVQVNAYAGWRTSHGFDLHWDDHDVFVLQVAGRKHWKVYGQTRRFPLKRDVEPAVDPPSEVLWEGLLEAGSLLYIPRGWWHVATPLDEPTLHLTVGVNNATGNDLLRWFTERLKREEIVRSDLPLFGPAHDRAAFADNLRDAILRNWDERLVDEYLQDADAQAGPRPALTLPWGATAEAMPPRGSVIRWAVSRVPVLDTSTDEISFVACGRRWRFAPAAEPLLNLLTTGLPCSLEQLEQASSSVSSDSVQNLVRDLAVHGLVTIVTR